MAGIGAIFAGAGTAFPLAFSKDNENHRRDHGRRDRADDQDIGKVHIQPPIPHSTQIR